MAIIAALLSLLGWFLPLHDYLTPKNGVGYWMGIVGASMMLLLLTYSLRKRYKFLDWTPVLSRWFNAHIFLGLYGPVLILYHCGYSLGAFNSNIALWSMITVAISGVIGRFLYNRPQFKRAFGIWHIAHLPFVFMLAVAAVIHIVAVNIY